MRSNNWAPTSPPPSEWHTLLIADEGGEREERGSDLLPRSHRLREVLWLRVRATRKSALNGMQGWPRLPWTTESFPPSLWDSHVLERRKNEHATARARACMHRQAENQCQFAPYPRASPIYTYYYVVVRISWSTGPSRRGPKKSHTINPFLFDTRCDKLFPRSRENNAVTDSRHKETVSRCTYIIMENQEHAHTHTKSNCMSVHKYMILEYAYILKILSSNHIFMLYVSNTFWPSIIPSLEGI